MSELKCDKKQSGCGAIFIGFTGQKRGLCPECKAARRHLRNCHKKGTARKPVVSDAARREEIHRGRVKEFRSLFGR